jgi:DNA-binding IclR family transcriptional regulator
MIVDFSMPNRVAWLALRELHQSHPAALYCHSLFLLFLRVQLLTIALYYYYSNYMEKLPAQKVNGLIDGIAVLQELAVSPAPCSGKAIAERLGLNTVRVNRLLKTLAFLGLTYRTASRKYSIGPGMHVLAAQSMAASGLLNRALPYLVKLYQLNKTVALGVLWKNQVCYLYHNSSLQNEADTANFAAGLGRMTLYPATKSSIGQVLLSRLNPEQLSFTLGETPDDDILKTLRKVRKQGYASVKHGDHTSLAFAVGQPPYAAMAVSGIKGKGEENKFIKLLKEYTNKLTNS